MHRLSNLPTHGILLSLILASVLWLLTPHLPLFDLSLFWKASQHLVIGQNPYHLPPYAEFVNPEFKAIAPSGVTLPALSSPAALGLLWFFGKLSLSAAEDLYLFLMYFAFSWASWLGCARLSGERILSPGLELGLLLAALPLGAFYQVMLWGSLSVFCLLGICLFLLFYDAQRPFLAGCSLAFCLVKPQLFALFFLYVLWWCLAKRAISVLFGLAAGLTVAVGIALYLQPSVLWMYWQVFGGNMPFLAVTNASLGGILFALLGKTQPIVMFLPLAIALPVLCLLLSMRGIGDLRMSSMHVLPWSLLFSPYCWGHDYVVCFPLAFMLVNYLKRGITGRKSAVMIPAATALVLITVVGDLVSPGFSAQSMFVLYGLSLCVASAVAVRISSAGMEAHPGVSAS